MSTGPNEQARQVRGAVRALNDALTEAWNSGLHLEAEVEHVDRLERAYGCPQIKVETFLPMPSDEGTDRG